MVLDDASWYVGRDASGCCSCELFVMSETSSVALAGSTAAMVDADACEAAVECNGSCYALRGPTGRPVLVRFRP